MTDSAETGKYRASGADLLMVGSRYIGIHGPVAPRSVEQVRELLATVVGSGPHTRVGLRPRPGVSWTYHNDLSKDSVREIEPARTVAELAERAEGVRRETGDKPPLQLILCGEYVLVDTAHELGDGKLHTDVIGALNDPTSPWVRTPETKAPLARALVRWFGAAPKHVPDMLRARTRLQGRSSPDRDEGDRTAPWAPSYSLVIAQSAPSTEKRLTDWRRTNAPGASAAALTIALLHEALYRVGLRTSPEVVVAVNCRRYLPPSSTVNGNFAIGISTPYPRLEELAADAAAMSALFESGVPLAWLALGATMTRLRPNVFRTPTTVATDPTVKLMYSDLGRAPDMPKAQWSNDSRVYTGLLDPGGPDAVTVMCGTVSGERTYSVSFHDNVFDRAQVEHALALVTERPFELLPKGGSRLD